MAATWSILNLDRQVSLNGKSDVVTTIHWQVTDSETVGEVKHQGRHARPPGQQGFKV